MSPLSKFELALRGLLELDMQELVDAGAILTAIMLCGMSSRPIA